MAAGDQVETTIPGEEKPARVGKRLILGVGDDARRGEEQAVNDIGGHGLSRGAEPIIESNASPQSKSGANVSYCVAA